MFNRSKTLAASLLVATFALGVAVGGVALAAWGERTEGPPRGPRERLSYAERLERELALTPAQRESVNIILDRRQESMHELWREIGPRFDTLRARIRTDIMAVLDDSQRVAYEELLARSDRRRGSRERGSHGR